MHWTAFALLPLLWIADQPQPPLPLPLQLPLCRAADSFLRTDRQMETVVEPDTVDDWRTKRRQFGCRITAAGRTSRGLQPEAVAFYERVRASGWVRTPDPADSPNEGSLRFRADGADCLFNVYGDAMLMTDAELTVDARVVPSAKETRYHVYVMCMPALPAAPRDSLPTGVPAGHSGV